MRYLLDTHLLLWAAHEDPRLPEQARTIINDEANELFFSSIGIWEIAIKAAKGLADFGPNPRELRRALCDNGYTEIPLSSDHAVAIDLLPSIHGDPFDQILIAQAMVEDLMLLTCDSTIAKYPGPIRKV